MSLSRSTVDIRRNRLAAGTQLEHRHRSLDVGVGRCRRIHLGDFRRLASRAPSGLLFQHRQPLEPPRVVLCAHRILYRFCRPRRRCVSSTSFARCAHSPFPVRQPSPPASFAIARSPTRTSPALSSALSLLFTDSGTSPPSSPPDRQFRTPSAARKAAIQLFLLIDKTWSSARRRALAAAPLSRRLTQRST